MGLSSRATSGFTLLELMIGISLGVVVLGGIIAVFTPTLMSWQTTSANAYIQDTEKIAHDIFDRAIRPASKLACDDENVPIQVAISATIDAGVSSWAFNFDESMQMFGANTSNTELSNVFGSTLNTNRLSEDYTSTGNKVGDILVTLAPDTRRYLIDGGNTSDGEIQFLNSADVNIKAGELFLVHSCEQPVVLRADANSSAALKYTSPIALTTSTLSNIVVSGFEPTVYYLGQQKTSPNEFTPALYSWRIRRTGATVAMQQPPDPALIGVENLRILYLISPSSSFVPTGNPDVCCTAQQLATGSGGQGPGGVGTIADVNGIQIVMMMQTPQKVAANLQNELTFPGLNGNNYNCLHDGSIDAPGREETSFAQKACPALIDNTKIHRVVSYVYDLPGRL